MCQTWGKFSVFTSMGRNILHISVKLWRMYFCTQTSITIILSINMPCFLFAWALKSDSLSFCKRTNRILPKYSLERNEELAVLLLLSYFYYPLSWPLVFWQFSKKCSHNFAVSQEWQVHGEFWVFCQSWVTQAHGFFLRTSWNGHRKVLTWQLWEWV